MPECWLYTIQGKKQLFVLPVGGTAFLLARTVHIIITIITLIMIVILLY